MSGQQATGELPEPIESVAVDGSRRELLHSVVKVSGRWIVVSS
jgi:hypothetical protein